MLLECHGAQPFQCLFSHTILGIQDSLIHPNFFPSQPEASYFHLFLLYGTIDLQLRLSLYGAAGIRFTSIEPFSNSSYEYPTRIEALHFLSGYQPCPYKMYPPKRQHRHSRLSGSRLVFRISNLVTLVLVGFCQTKPLPNNIYGGSSFDPGFFAISFPESYSSRSKKDLLSHWRVDKHCKQFLKFYVLLSILVHLLGIPFY